MFIDQYYSEQDGTISFTREQGSEFAKRVADDFNPLHDADAKRFCIPGDLLFSVVLSRYGLSRHMEFTFSGMVLEGVELVLPEPGPELSLDDTEGRHYLSINRSGQNSMRESLIQNLTRNYVEFSGHTFPHILVPLLEEQGLMINPARPMVFYQSMIIDMETLDVDSAELEIDHNELTTDGKRGDARLMFKFISGGELIGRGEKNMVLGGLREYDRTAVEAAVDEFNQRRMAYTAN
ncbi:MAG: DUF3581 family protein [Haliea sp.]|jgi:hypothetical protein|nr:DUF3581 family protein [Haliea sp.]